MIWRIGERHAKPGLRFDHGADRGQRSAAACQKNAMRVDIVAQFRGGRAEHFSHEIDDMLRVLLGNACDFGGRDSKACREPKWSGTE